MPARGGPPGRRVAARQITEVDPGGDTGRRQLPVPPPVERPGPAPGGGRRCGAGRDRARWPSGGWRGVRGRLLLAVGAALPRASPPAASTSGTWSRRSGAPPQGRLLDTTDVSGVQFNRLGAHVDPVLALFAPLWWVWSSPEMLLVAQAVIVSTGALPAFWLGRRWLGDDRLAAGGRGRLPALPGAAARDALRLPPGDARRAAPAVLHLGRGGGALGGARGLRDARRAHTGAGGPDARGAGGVWLWSSPRPAPGGGGARGGRPRVGRVAVAVIMPAFAIDGSNPHMGRYSSLGDSPIDIALTFVTRPWDAIAIVATPGRALYLVGLLVPLLLLPLAAPVLALARLPQLAHQPLRQRRPGADRGLPLRRRAGAVPRRGRAAGAGAPARARARRRARPLDPARPGWWPGALVGAVIVAGVFQGPLPLWGWMPGGCGGSARHALHRWTPRPRAARARWRSSRPTPAVSAANDAGSHLSARRRILLFPKLGDADCVLFADDARLRAMARDRPTLRPPGYR